MSKQPADLTALSYSIDSIGKLFSDSKTRHTWTFDVEGETQVVVVVASWNTSKFVVELNGYERFHQVVSGMFVYSFKFRERYFKISARGQDFVLLIDAIPFDAYTAKSKAAQAALLKSYESRPKPVPRVSEEEEPFMGDLGKRLGKKREDYVVQNDEDVFAGVQVQSYITELTVIPDLLDLADDAKTENDPEKTENQETKDVDQDSPRETPPKTPPKTPPNLEESSPVTPRDQISPSNLVNPFFAVNPFV